VVCCSGNHLVEVISDGELVAGGSFTSKAYNTAAIAVSPINMGVAGMPVEFSSQYTQSHRSPISSSGVVAGKQGGGQLPTSLNFSLSENFLLLRNFFL